MSFDMLKNICRSVAIPVVAIGGINLSNVSKLAKTGIKGVAVISGILTETDICGTSEEFRRILKIYKTQRHAGGTTLCRYTKLMHGGKY